MTEGNLYQYNPNSAIAAVAAVLFGISSCFHLFQMIQKRTWFYLAMTIGGFMMTAGYVFRVLSIHSPHSLLLYILQAVLLLLPPSLYAATIYMIYGRTVLFVNAPDASIIRPTWVTKIFVIGDVFSFLVQAYGGSMEAQASKAKTGSHIVLIGLASQLIFFGFFLVVAIIFDRRMSKSPLRYTVPTYGKHNWRSLLLLLLGAAVFIIVRCLYRVAEFAPGNGGYLMSHEWPMYVGDTLPMLVVQVVFHIIHAGDVFPRGQTQKSEEESYINLEER
ncbi:RTA1 like protein [Mollisia scopiformis]|uniref:RTA1 like protein n=1 Tax=Mollisia scopiformis TaxID=149040 RepID=A0A194XPJ2_MOLSC|nr:RTA1 like protein [Mollisia scopiformis]KUJ21657.1 RTA1 like protein [Mollisia scopiformis]